MKETHHFQWLRDFVPFRNELHHTAQRPDAEYEAELSQRVPGLAAILDRTEFLHDFPIVQPTSTESATMWRGSAARQARVAGRFPPHAIGRMGFVLRDDTFGLAGPFAMILGCEKCRTQQFFLYDSQRRYDPHSGKSRSYMMEYDAGHRWAFRQPVRLFEETFSADDLAEATETRRRSLVPLEQYAANVDGIIRQHGAFTGRQFLREEFERFMECQSGILLITGPPGIGKSAFVAHVAARSKNAARFFFAPQDCATTTASLLVSVSHQLADIHGVELPATSATDADALRRRLESLLSRIAAHGEGRDEVLILIDALDEAAPGTGPDSAPAALPGSLPDGVHIVATARSGWSGLASLRIRADVRECRLQQDSPCNIADIHAYIERRLGRSCSRATQRAIATKAEWNFLFVKHLCDAVATGAASVDDVVAFLGRDVRLQSWYEVFWNKAILGPSPEGSDSNVCCSILGSVATGCGAVSAGQIIEMNGLTSLQFTMAMRVVGQFLEIISPENAPGTLREASDERVWYRIYHESFRAFVLTKLPHLRVYHQRWADLLLDWPSLSGYDRHCATSYLPYHLALARDWANLEQVIDDPDFLQAAGGSAFERAFRLESPHWQRALVDWLEHLLGSEDDRRGIAKAASLYFRAFWWWGMYLPFPFCERLISLIRDSKVSSMASGPIALLLSEFHANYPRASDWKHYWTRRQQWRTVATTVRRIRRFFGLPADDETTNPGCLNAYTAVFLADALSALGDPACISLYESACSELARDDAEFWSVSYVRSSLAESLTMRGDARQAVDAARVAAAEAESSDWEAQSQAHRVLADALWMQQRYQDAWKAYAMAAFFAFKYQGNPVLDAYTAKHQHEMCDRAVTRLFELAAVDPDRAVRMAVWMRSFWRDYWKDTTGSAPTLSVETIREFLTPGKTEEALAHLFPPIPVPGDPQYVDKAGAVCEAMAERTAAVQAGLGTLAGDETDTISTRNNNESIGSHGHPDPRHDRA